MSNLHSRDRAPEDSQDKSSAADPQSLQRSTTNPQARLESRQTGSATNPHSDSFIVARLQALQDAASSANPRADAYIQGQVDQPGASHQTPVGPTSILDLMTLESLPLDARAVLSSPHDLLQPSLDDEAVEQHTAANDSLGQVLCVTQSSKMAWFSLKWHHVLCTFYYDAASDGLVLANQSAVAVLARPFVNYQLDDGQRLLLRPRSACVLCPGPWRVSPAQGEDQWTDIVILPRRFVVHKSVPPRAHVGLKRSNHALEESAPKRVRKQGHDVDHGVILLANQSDDKITVVTSGQPAADLKLGETLVIRSAAGGGSVAESGDESWSEDYSLSHLRNIAIHKGSCCVFRANHAVFGSLAVKVICSPKAAPLYLSIPKVAQMWEREERLMRRLSHPCIVRFIGSDARLHTIYMEYLPFPDLIALRETTASGSHFFSGTTQDAERVLDDLASALAYLEDQGIVHNDIKPGNIIYDGRRGATLIDFGLASTRGDPVCNGGTPWYVPYEYRQHQGGFKSDMFALGVTLLYLLKKTPAPDMTARGWVIVDVFKVPSQIALMNEWLDKVESYADELQPTGIEALVRAALVRDPDKRISAREMLEMRRKSDYLGPE